MKKAIATASILVGAWLLPSATSAQAPYPSKPIKLIVGFNAGAATDLIARHYAKGIQARLGQPVVVENLTGNGGNTAISVLAKSPADGYTVALGANYIAVNAAMGRNPYDWRTELKAVAPVASISNLLVVPSQSKISSVADLVAQAKMRQDKPLMFGSAGVGTSMHMAGELFRATIGANLVHVPYRGAAPAEMDLMSGRLDLIFDSVATAVPLVASGKLKPLAVTSAQRNPELPDIPTMQEAGVAGFDVTGTYILMAPAGVSAAITDKLGRAIQEISAEAGTRQYLATLHSLPLVGGPDEANKILESEYEKWSGVIKTLNLTFE